MAVVAEKDAVAVVEVVVEMGRGGRVCAIPIIRMPMPGDNGDLRLIVCASE